MALNFPFAEYMQAALARPRMTIDAMNQLGQSAADASGGFAQYAQARRRQQLLQQLSQLMSSQGQPLQGPTMTGQPIGPADNSGQIMGLMTKLDPMEAIKMRFKMMQDQQNTVPAFIDDQGQFSPFMKPGFKPYGVMQRDKFGTILSNQSKTEQTMEEKKAEAESNRHLKELAEETRKLIAEGNLEAAHARIQEAKERAASDREERRRKDLLDQSIKAQIANQKLGPIDRYILRKKPVRDPLDPNTGWTDAEEQRLRELEAKAR